MLILDARDIIRYVGKVPMDQLPDFEQAFRVSCSLLAKVSYEVTQ